MGLFIKALNCTIFVLNYNHMKKQLLAIIISFISMAMLNAQDLDDDTVFFDCIEHNLCYSIVNNNDVELKATTLKNNESGRVIFIPDSISIKGRRYRVASIADNAFRNCMAVDSVFMAEGISTIGASAFENCGNLKYVVIPEGVVSLGENSFKGCSLLAKMSLPYSVSFIGNFTFADCTSLTSLSFSAQVETVGPSVFRGCSSLKTINVDEQNPYMTSVDGVLYNKVVNMLICCPDARTTALVLPKSVSFISWPFSKEMKLMCLSCYSETPPVVNATWPEQLPATLFVPKRFVSVYEQHAFWARFVIRPY